MKSTPPPDPGVGYRLLKPARGRFRGEIIRDGDEFYLNGYWFASTQEGDRQGAVGPRGDKWRRRRTDVPIQAVEALDVLARKITRDLFTSGSGMVARRLVMEPPAEKIEGTGWSQAAVFERVRAMLKGEL